MEGRGAAVPLRHLPHPQRRDLVGALVHRRRCTCSSATSWSPRWATSGCCGSRRASLRSTNRLESVVSREAEARAQQLRILWGTMFPVLWRYAAQDLRVFNKLTGPFAAALLFLTGVGPLIAWRRASPTSLRRRFVMWDSSAAAVVLALGDAVAAYPVVFWSLGAFVTATIGQEYWRAVGARMRNAGESRRRRSRHACCAGPAPLRRLHRPPRHRLHPDRTVGLGVQRGAPRERRREHLDGRRFYLTAKASKRRATAAPSRLALFHGSEPLAVMAPERRVYWLEQQPASIPSIRCSTEAST